MPAVREFWADSLATLCESRRHHGLFFRFLKPSWLCADNNLTYGTVGAGQWDGAEFHLMAGWDFPHSKQTLNSGPFHMGGPGSTFPGYWGGSITKTFGQAHDLWAQKPAIEMSLLLPGRPTNRLLTDIPRWTAFSHRWYMCCCCRVWRRGGAI